MGRYVTAALLIVLSASVVHAGVWVDIKGGSFEFGGPMPDGFTTAGNTDVLTAPFSVGGGAVTAFDGSSFLVSSTGGVTSSLPAGTGPFPFFMGDPAGTDSLITEYSGFSFTVDISVWTVIRAWVNVFTSEHTAGVPDILAAYVARDAGAPELVGGWVISPFSSPSPDFMPLGPTDFDGIPITDPVFGSFVDGQTGWFPITTEFHSAGTYTVYLIVGDTFDTIEDTAFAVDDIEIYEVPEPGTWALFGLGALGLVGYRRIKRKKTAA